MKTLKFIVIFLININLFSQDILWEKTLGGKHAEYLFDAIPTPDYGMILVGSSLSSQTGDVEQKSKGDFDFFITKLDENGNTEWIQNIGGDAVDMLQSINRTFDGGYIIAGTSRSSISGDKTSSNMGQDDIWLLKMDMKGNIQWQKTLGGIAEDKVAVVLPSKEGGYILAGSSASEVYKIKTGENEASQQLTIAKSENNKGSLDYWVVKMDASGNVLWQKTLGGKLVDQIKSVVELEDKSIVLGGNSNSVLGLDKETENNGMNDWWLVKIDADGHVQWQRSYGGSGDDQLSSLIVTKDDNIMAGGYFSESQDKRVTSDFVMIKIDPTGKSIWQKSYDQGAKDFLIDLVQNQDGSFLMSGYSAVEKTMHKSSKPEDGIEDFIAVKFDIEGNELWHKTIETKQKEVLTRTIETRDGGYVMMGTQMPLQTEGNNNANFYVVKLLDRAKPLKEKSLIEALPNPTVEYTAIVIGYEYEKGICTVVDLSGRVMQEFEITGNRTVPIQLKGYPDGVYIVSIKTDKGEDGVKVLKTSN